MEGIGAACALLACAVDANGNLTARGSDTFGYDQANRLRTASVAGTSASYSYDGDGKRSSKAVGAASTAYTYDVNASLPVLLDDGVRKYVWGLGLAFAVDPSSTTRTASARSEPSPIPRAASSRPTSTTSTGSSPPAAAPSPSPSATRASSGTPKRAWYISGRGTMIRRVGGSSPRTCSPLSQIYRKL